MNIWKVVLFVLGLASMSAVSTKEQQQLIDPSIINLTQENFQQKTGSSLPFVDSTDKMSNQWFVIFYSPTCPHCKKAMPHWNQFAKLVKEKGPSMDWLKVGAVDCKMETDLCSQLQIKLYPSFVFLSRLHKTSEFKGDRNKDEWMKYAQNRHRDTKDAESRGATSQGANSKMNPSGSSQSTSNNETKSPNIKKDPAALAAKRAKLKAKQAASSKNKGGFFSAIWQLTGFQVLQLLIIGGLIAALAYLLLGVDQEGSRKDIGWRTAHRYEDNRGLSLPQEA